MYKKTVLKSALLVLALLLQNIPATAFAAKWKIRQASNENHFITTLSCDKPPSVGSFQNCYLDIIVGDTTLKKAIIGIGGGMPEHRHGLPTEPIVTWSDKNKTYVIKGLKFSMPGNWVLHFYISDPENNIKDKSTFKLTI